ncbi:MAG: phosphate uptake regulator PhoU, partial [Candidatus Heimdallarchaeota archaeon]|nr:phosphate uptake regulator PhoU [Candidatus Heimdallarchaeota archaeon]
MDIRRVQITGGSSYIITLPKSWINSQKIKSKQKVGIVTKPDGNLLIIPDMSKESSHKIKKIFISIDLDDELVFRMLLGAYIMGFEEIHVESKVEIPPKVRNTVSKFINAVDKFEISEESDTIIKIKDMLDDKVSFEKKIIGINTLVQSMFTEALKALNQNNIPLCEQVIKTDTFLNTKAWLIVRQMNQLFENSSLEVTIPPKILHHYGIISQYLGRIGNYSAEIAENIIKLINLESAPISQPIINEISKISEEILVDLNNSLDILFLTFAQESN